MTKQQRGLGKGLGALLGGNPDLSQIRKPVGYVNKQVVSNAQQPQDTADILRIPIDIDTRFRVGSTLEQFVRCVDRGH